MEQMDGMMITLLGSMLKDEPQADALETTLGLLT